MTTSARQPRPVTIPITELEQSAFCQTDSELRTRTLEDEFRTGVQWQKVPIRYLKLKPDEISEGIAEVKAELGKDLTILGHHYQRADVVQYADFRGDSYKLSQMAAAEREAKYVAFCGVHFMAETADILTSDEQQIILPNLAAGCSMADMARSGDAEDAWADLMGILGEADEIIPITYMNSTAAIKALCGRNNGIVCTSSNADKAFDWALSRGKRVLFLPDQHLGRNTALTKGIKADEMIIWSPFKPLGGHSPEAIRRSKVILWEGHCSVHTRFTPQQIDDARAKYPDVNVIVHPECTQETVAAADMFGSTEKIVQVVTDSPSGSIWGIGTEINLVNRLAKENPDKTVFCLDPIVCPCATMYRVHPAYLLWVLEGLRGGMTINQIKVPEATADEARLALERMLDLAR